MPPRPDFDLYEALEVSKASTLQEITASYRRLARIHHPDKNPNDAAATVRFQRVSIFLHFTFSCLSQLQVVACLILY